MPPPRKAAALEEIKDVIESGTVMGLPVDIEPHEALLTCVRITAGEVAYTSRIVYRLEESDALARPTQEKQEQRIAIDADGEVVDAGMGVTEIIVREFTLNIWIQARQDAVARLARYAKMAIDAGVAERQVRVAEQHGDMIAATLTAILGELDLKPKDQKRLPDLIRTHLTAIEGQVLEMPRTE